MKNISSSKCNKNSNSIYIYFALNNKKIIIDFKRMILKYNYKIN